MTTQQTTRQCDAMLSSFHSLLLKKANKHVLTWLLSGALRFVPHFEHKVLKKNNRKINMKNTPISFCSISCMSAL